MLNKEEFLKEHNQQVLENRRVEKWEKIEKRVMNWVIVLTVGYMIVIALNYFKVI